MISKTDFMMKFDFYENDIPQYSKVKIQAIINGCCLVEDINTYNRKWVMKYEIYPLNNYDNYGDWEFNKYYDQIACDKNLK